MWRLLLAFGLCTVLLCGVAQAQIDRNAGSRNSAPKKPRKPADVPSTSARAKERAGLSPAQLALAQALVEACRDNADLTDVARNLATAHAQPAPAQAVPPPVSAVVKPPPPPVAPAQPAPSVPPAAPQGPAAAPPQAPPAAADTAPRTPPAVRETPAEDPPAAQEQPPVAPPAAPPPARPQDAVQHAPAGPDAEPPATPVPAATGQAEAQAQPPPGLGDASAAQPVTQRSEDELKSRRPQLKITRRERPAEPPAPEAAIATQDAPGSAASMDDTHSGVPADVLDSAANAAAADLRHHAAGLPQPPPEGGAPAPAEPEAAEAPVMDTPAPDQAEPVAEAAAAEEQPAAAAALSDGFSAPFTPRNNHTTLDQVTSRRNAPDRAAPPAAAMAIPDAGADAPIAPAADFALPETGAAAAAQLSPLSVSTAPGALSAVFSGGAPVELMLPHEAPRMPDFPVRPDLQVLTRGNAKRKQVALTFDDGPHPQFTSQILAELAYYRVPATFFFVGLQAQKYPQWVRMAHQAGHEIGNHTYDHFRIPKLPRAEQEYQIDEYQRLIEGLVGVKPRFMRPPGGQLDKQTQALIAKRGMVVAMWDVNLNDTKAGKSAHDLLKTSMKNIRPGSVILAHDGIQSAIDMLPELITSLRQQGYEFVTLSELASGL